MKSPEKAELYEKILKKFNYRCALDKSHPVYPYSTPHHILPRGSGGKDTEDNLIPLCPKCHGKIHQEGTRKWRSKLESILRSQL